MDAVSFSVVETPGGYLAVAEGGALVTVADDFEVLKSMVRDAVNCHYDASDRPGKVTLVFDLEQVPVP